MDISELDFLNTEHCFFAHQLKGQSWMDKAIGKMTSPVYISFDLDALDPSIMPSTGTPEPGGLGWNDTLHFLRRVFNEKRVVGFDIVELAPILTLPAPDFLVAKMYYKMLSYQFEKHDHVK